jgi:hypothetical protein
MRKPGRTPSIVSDDPRRETMANGRGGRSWTADEERELMALVAREVPHAVIAKTLQRTVAAIENRLNIVKNRQMLSAHRETEA